MLLVGCLLFVCCCLLLCDINCSILFASWMLFLFVDCGLLFVDCCLWRVLVCWSLVVGCWFLLLLIV